VAAVAVAPGDAAGPLDLALAEGIGRSTERSVVAEVGGVDIGATDAVDVAAVTAVRSGATSGWDSWSGDAGAAGSAPAVGEPGEDADDDCARQRITPSSTPTSAPAPRRRGIARLDRGVGVATTGATSA
jgi:hypothetical protein